MTSPGGTAHGIPASRDPPATARSSRGPRRKETSWDRSEGIEGSCPSRVAWASRRTWSHDDCSRRRSVPPASIPAAGPPPPRAAPRPRPDRRRPGVTATSSRSASSGRGRRARRPTPASARWSPGTSRQGAAVREQPFAAVDPLSGARVDDGQPDRLLASRADPSGSCSAPTTTPAPSPTRSPTRPAAGLPFLGANDGASGVALLMEIAHHLNEPADPLGGRPRPLRRRGAGLRRGRRVFPRLQGVRPGLCRGPAKRRGAPRYVAGLVLDMVGDARPGDRPGAAQPRTRPPARPGRLGGRARRSKAPAFRNRVGRAVLDDHLPLNNAGIPAIDIIDFDYPALAHHARPARELLGRQPGAGRPGRHRLAQSGIAPPEPPSPGRESRRMRSANSTGGPVSYLGR